jgi:RNA polymerase-binding protein DksA
MEETMRKLDPEKYRKMLLQERERLHKEIEYIEQDVSYSDAGGTSELADYDQHPADTGSETYEREKDLAIRDSWREIIGRIDEALGEIDRGTYGQCDRCGRDIPKERLDAIPYAIYCVECQDIIEGR